MRRPDAAAAPSGVTPPLTLTPRDGSGDLPLWRPATPADGWSPESVFAASVDYATTEAAAVLLPIRRVILIAQRALFGALPSGVKRAQVLDRLRGVDHAAAYFDEPVRAFGADGPLAPF